MADAPPVDHAHTGRRDRGRRRARHDPHRLRRDRGDHLVHEHLEPDGDGRGRAARPERRRPRAARRADRQDVARARARKAVTGYLEAAGLMAPLEALGFALAGYGCTTCIGNSGPLDEPVAEADRGQRPGRRGRPVGQPQLRGPDPSRSRGRATSRRRRSSSRSRSPAASTSTSRTEPLGIGDDGGPVFLADIWPSPEEIRSVIGTLDRPGAVPADLRGRLRGRRALAGAADPRRRSLRLGPASTYIAQAAVLRGHDDGRRRRSTDIVGARVARGPRRLGHDRPHLARPARSRRGRPPASGSRSAASVRSSSTRTAPGAATTRS